MYHTVPFLTLRVSQEQLDQVSQVARRLGVSRGAVTRLALDTLVSMMYHTSAPDASQDAPGPGRAVGPPPPHSLPGPDSSAACFYCRVGEQHPEFSGCSNWNPRA